MHPELFTIPGLGVSIKTYGFFLAVGFLSAVWLAMRRAARVKADPDRVLDMAFLALIFGVGGARLFFVVHYWRDFAVQPNKLWAIIDIRQGGLEFLGGLLGGMAAIIIYIAWKRLSIRMYLDILAPSGMWGLAFGRLGCFFNGCCFGGLCVVGAEAQAPQYPWAVRFPYGSNPAISQWEDRKITVPAELIFTRTAIPSLVPAKALFAPVEQRDQIRTEVRQLEEALAEAKARQANAEEVKKLEAQLNAAKARWEVIRRDLGLDALDHALRFRSRENPERTISVTELQDLAAAAQSLPVHPTQLYASINAFLLSGFLSAVFYIRRRHGVVIGLLVVLYPISRVLLEIIRADNPHDVGGLTISQFVGVSMFAGGLLYLLVLYRMPLRSPRAVPVPREEEPDSA